MSAIAIIPARGGSKRIPRKNIREFMGKPMVSYAISVARESGVFDEVMVSTEDEEIADIARRYGAAVPFLRSAAAASDSATVVDVAVEVLSAYRTGGRTFDVACGLYPCAPLLPAEVLREAFNAFSTCEADMLMAAVRYPHPVQRAFSLSADGIVGYREPENENLRTQDLEPLFHDAGMFYFARTESVFAGRLSRKAAVVLPESMVQDIDTEDDWRTAELKYKLLNDVQDRA